MFVQPFAWLATYVRNVRHDARFHQRGIALHIPDDFVARTNIALLYAPKSKKKNG